MWVMPAWQDGFLLTVLDFHPLVLCWLMAETYFQWFFCLFLFLVFFFSPSDLSLTFFRWHGKKSKQESKEKKKQQTNLKSRKTVKSQNISIWKNSLSEMLWMENVGRCNLDSWIKTIILNICKTVFKKKVFSFYVRQSHKHFVFWCLCSLDEAVNIHSRPHWHVSKVPLACTLFWLWPLAS